VYGRGGKSAGTVVFSVRKVREIVKKGEGTGIKGCGWWDVCPPPPSLSVP